MSVTDDWAGRFVILRDGPAVPAAPYVLLLSLEARGCHVQADGETLVVGPSSLLTDEDRASIRRWKWHLLMLLRHCQRPGLDRHLFTDDAPAAAERRAS